MPRRPELPKRDPKVEVVAALLAQVISEVRLCDEWSETLFGMTAAQLRLLCEIVLDRGQSVNELSTKLSTHQSSTSQQLARLRDAGLVLVRDGKEDSRVVRVAPTAKGRRMALQTNLMGRPLLSASLSLLSPSHLSRLGECLQTLADGMEAERVLISQQ